MIRESDRVAIALAEDDLHRVDNKQMFGGDSKFTVETGPVWRKVFYGNDPRAIFDITAARAWVSYPALGFAIRVHYEASGTLTLNGKAHSLTCKEHRSGPIETPDMLRGAVEACVLASANQAASMLQAP